MQVGSGRTNLWVWIRGKDEEGGLGKEGGLAQREANWVYLAEWKQPGVWGSAEWKVNSMQWMCKIKHLKGRKRGRKGGRREEGRGKNQLKEQEKRYCEDLHTEWESCHIMELESEPLWGRLQWFQQYGPRQWAAQIFGGAEVVIKANFLFVWKVCD